MALSARLLTRAGKQALPRALPAASFHASLPNNKLEGETEISGMGSRFAVTAEVTVSKLAPAGVGWQASSIVADGMGYGATDLAFFGITGLGDGAGVLAGHTSFYLIKKAIADPSIDAGKVFGDGVWLGTAAVCSGAAWQPIVNFWQGLGVSFPVVFAGAWVGCGFMFFSGLRLGRIIYPFVPDVNHDNLVADAALSSTIGGATAFFVGTDTEYLSGEGNFLRPVVGIEDSDSDPIGCIKAGTSTALGFALAQSAQNIVYPAGKCWLD